MGNQDDRPALHLSGQAGPDLLVCGRVHRGKRIVKDHNRRLSHQHAGYGSPLDLAAGKGHAPLSDISLIPIREMRNRTVQGSHVRVFPDGIQVRPVFRNRNVFRDRSRKQIGFLQNRPDMPAQPFEPDMGDIVAAYGNPALSFRQLIKPGQQPYKGRFAGPGPAQNTDRRSRGNGQGQMLQHLTGLFPGGILILFLRTLSRIGKGNILKNNISAHIRLFRVRPVFLRRRVHDLPDPVQRYGRLAHLRNRLGHHTDRPGQHGGIGSQRYVIPGADPPLYAKISSKDGHDHDLCGGDQVACCPERGGYAGMIHVGLRVCIVLGREALPFVLLPAKRPDHPDSCQVLLGNGGKLSFLHIRVLVRRSDLIMEISGIQENNRNKKGFRQSQRGGDARDEIHGQDNQDHDPQQVDHLLRNKGLDHLHIRCTALDQVSCPVPDVPGQGQDCDLIIQGIPHRPDQGLRPGRIAAAEAISEKGSRQGDADDGQRDRPQMRLQIRGPAQGIDQKTQGKDCFRAAVPDNTVDRIADNAGIDQVQQSHQGSRKNSCKKVSAAALQKI